MSTTPPGLPPNQPQYPQQYPQQPVVKKKTSPLVWILGGILIFIFLVIGLVTAGGYMFYRTVKKAGFDPDLMRRNPGLAMTSMLTAINPNLERVSFDEKAGTITMRDKTTGKVVTFRFDPDKKQMVILDDQGKQVTMKADGAPGSFEVQSSDGTFKAGAAASGTQLPPWIPVYPGTTPQGMYSSETAQGSQRMFSMKTADAASKVLTYYQDQLKSAGFQTVITQSDQGGLVQATDNSNNRTVMVTASLGTGNDSGNTLVSITAVEKKQ